MGSIQDKAAEAAAWFVTDTRDNGDVFIKTKDDRPEWLTDLIHDAHGDKFSDDYRYQFISEALDAIADSGETEDDAQDRIYEIEPDVYTSALTAWLNSRADRVYYLTEALEEMDGMCDGFQLLAWAQNREQMEVAQSVLASLAKLTEEDEED